MDENEKHWAGTWIERPQSISLCNRCVFVGWRHLKHTPSPCKNWVLEVLHLFRCFTHTHIHILYIYIHRPTHKMRARVNPHFSGRVRAWRSPWGSPGWGDGIATGPAPLASQLTQLTATLITSTAANRHREPHLRSLLRWAPAEPWKHSAIV